MEDLQIIRKNRGNSTSFKGFENAVMSIRFPRGEFVFNKKAVELTQMNNEKAFMFGLSKNNNCAYLFSEEPDVDSYYPKHSKDGIYRFTCKDLAGHFNNFFDTNKKMLFDITLDNEKFKLTQRVK